MLITKSVIANWVYFKMRTSQEAWETPSLHLVVCVHVWKSYMCSKIISMQKKKKRTAVSHSRTEAETISRFADLRMEGIPVLN